MDVSELNCVYPLSTTAHPGCWWTPTAYLWDQDGNWRGFVVEVDDQAKGSE